VKAGETQVLDSTRQKECPISKFVQENVQDVMSGALNAGKTVTVRAVSDCEHHFAVPNPIRRYYRMADGPSSDPSQCTIQLPVNQSFLLRQTSDHL
jgi:hypothetical protein